MKSPGRETLLGLLLEETLPYNKGRKKLKHHVEASKYPPHAAEPQEPDFGTEGQEKKAEGGDAEPESQETDPDCQKAALSSREASERFWSRKHSPTTTYLRFANALGEPFTRGRDDVHEKLSKINKTLELVVNREDVQTNDPVLFQKLVEGSVAGLQLFAQEVNGTGYQQALELELHNQANFEAFLYDAAEKGRLGYCSGASALQNTLTWSGKALDKIFRKDNGECTRCGSTIAELAQRGDMPMETTSPESQERNTFEHLQWELARSHVVARSADSAAAAFMCYHCHKYGHFACFATAAGIIAHVTGDFLHPPINRAQAPISSRRTAASETANSTYVSEDGIRNDDESVVDESFQWDDFDAEILYPESDLAGLLDNALLGSLLDFVV